MNTKAILGFTLTLTSSLSLAASVLRINRNATTLSALLHPASPGLRSDYSPILCYTPSYASVYPSRSACATILEKEIGHRPDEAAPIIFSRRSALRHLAVPVKFTRRSCQIIVDVPGPGPGWELATWSDLREAVLALMVKCVMNNEGLGGIVDTGARWGLLVEIRGNEEREGRRRVSR
ncbi:MAG: hypothetical protein Q9209_007280 [Squamulea sp. 1 TL-2023]